MVAIGVPAGWVKLSVSTKAEFPVVIEGKANWFGTGSYLSNYLNNMK